MNIYLNWMHVARTKSFLCVGHNSYYKCRCGSCSQTILQGGVYFRNTARGPFCENCAKFLGMFPENLSLPKTASDLKRARENDRAEYRAWRRQQALETLAEVGLSDEPKSTNSAKERELRKLLSQLLYKEEGRT